MKGGLRTVNSCRHFADNLLSQTPLSNIDARFQPIPHPHQKITDVLLKKIPAITDVRLWEQQEHSYTAFSLACLEIRSRTLEAIDSTWNRIYLLKVLYLLPTLAKSGIVLFICFWIDLVHVLAMTRNACAIADYMRVWIQENSRASIPEKLHHCQWEIKKVIYMAHHFNHHRN